MHHPLFVIPLFVVIPGMRSPALCSGQGRPARLARIRQQVPQLQRLHQITVPNQALVRDTKVALERRFDVAECCISEGKGVLRAEHGGGLLHRGLHIGAQGRCGCGAIGEEEGGDFADGVEADALFGRIVGSARCMVVGDVEGRRPALASC